MSEYGPMLRSARESLSWTQDDLADRLNVHRSLVARWEAGRITPSIPQANSLIAVLPLSAERFFVALGANLTPPAAARLPRGMVEAILALPPEDWYLVERLARGLLAQHQAGLVGLPPAPRQTARTQP